jgi:hypothetical protein
MNLAWRKIMITAAGALSLATAASMWSGCSDPGPVEIGQTSISNRVIVTSMDREPSMDDPRDKIWDLVPTGAITVGGDSLEPAYTGPVYIKAIKANGRLFLRAVWTDDGRSIRPNGIVYVVSIVEDTISFPHHTDTTRTWVRNPSYAIVATPEGMVLYQYDQDRLAIMWDMGDNGTEKADCATMCHASEQMSPLGDRMYTTGGGHVDVWHWQAGTTDPVLLAEDECWDFQGRKPDDNVIPIFVSNFNETDGQPYFEHVDTTAFPGPFLHADSTRPFSDSLPWVSGYQMPGYVLYDNATGSIADVQANSTYNIGYTTRQWAVILSRALSTGNADDVDFSTIAPGDSVMATIAVMSNCDRYHAGSAPFYFIFR